MAKNLNLPATLIHEVNGKKYTLNGKLLAINESTKTCTMKFGAQISNNVPVKEVYLNETALGDIVKKAGKKVKEAAKNIWHKISGIIKTVGGFIVPADENGKALMQYVYAPVNLGLMKLPKHIKVAPSGNFEEIYDDYEAKVKNDSTIDELFEDGIAKDKEMIETYWTRVMKEYAKNESLNLSDTVKMVNEKYYHQSKGYTALNESIVSMSSPDPEFYGRNIGTNELIDAITDSVYHQLNPVNTESVKPLIIWGAPGIGKTAIIRQAGKDMKERFGRKLTFISQACGGIKQDDFELPDTTVNVAGQKIAISTPKVWLPVYDKKGLTPEQIAEVDAFYNSGKFAIRERKELKNLWGIFKNKSPKGVIDGETGVNGLSSDTPDELLKNSETFDGGILFIDEFGRVLEERTMNVFMTLLGDRQYQDLVVASQWAFICAANRLSDDKKMEDDEVYWGTQDAAKMSRFVHYTFVPTKEEWLRWARDVDANGYQNVDEIICKFIEWAPEGVWYDALDFGSRPVEDDAVAKIIGISKNGKRESGVWGTSDITIEEIKAVGRFISKPGKSKGNMQRTTWDPRTWHQKIAMPFLSTLKELFDENQKNGTKESAEEKYKACFREERRVYDEDSPKAGETYMVKNLDDKLLSEQLNSVDDNVWNRWTLGKYKSFDASQTKRKNNRLGFIMGWLGEIIKTVTGMNSMPANQWEQYNTNASVVDLADIVSIYETGHMKSKNTAKEDNILFPKGNMSDFAMVNSTKWKTNHKSVSDIVLRVLNEFDNQITLNQLKEDFVKIEKKIGKVPYSEADFERYKKEYTIHFIDIDGKPIKDVPTLFNDTIPYDEGMKELIVHVLRNSEVARKLCNLVMWLSKISIQVGSTEILGYLLDAHNTIGSETLKRRILTLASQDEDTKAFYHKPMEIRQYDVCKPANTILEAMVQYDEIINGTK